MKKFLSLGLGLMLTLIMSLSFVSCSDDDKPAANTTDAIAGVYIGTLNMVGMPSDEAEIAYVTMTRKSSSTVTCHIESEGWGVDIENVNLAVTFNGSVANLKSETSKQITGQIINGHLQLTYETVGDYVFQFIGQKD